MPAGTSQPASLPESRLGRLARKLGTRAQQVGTSGSGLVGQVLADCGIDTLFAIPGVPNYASLKACEAHGIRVFGTRHQFGATIASAACNLLAGTLRSAVMVSAAPAITNTLTGLFYAHTDRIPLLAIGGRRGARSGLAGEFQAVDVLPAVSPFSRYTALLDNTATLAAELRAAVHAAATPPRGPAYVDILEETLAGAAPPNATPGAPLQPQSGDSPQVLSTTIGQLADRLRRARRPAIVVGPDARWSDLPDLLVSLVGQTGAACLTLPTARGIVPNSHPAVLNLARPRVLAEADLVLVVGSDLDWQLRFGSEIDPATPVIVLHDDASTRPNRPNAEFTSLSPAAVLAGLVEEPDSLDTREKHRRDAWLDSLRATARDRLTALRRRAARSDCEITTTRLILEIAGFLPADAITVLDANLTMLAAQDLLSANFPGARLTAGSGGTMGVGVPLAIGARAARPRHCIVAICGDFAFGLSCQEIETAVRHGLPFIAVVVDNGGISAGTITHQCTADPAARLTTLASGTRFDHLASSFGGYGEYIVHPEQIRPALERAAAADRPMVLHVRTIHES